MYQYNPQELTLTPLQIAMGQESDQPKQAGTKTRTRKNNKPAILESQEQTTVQAEQMPADPYGFLSNAETLLHGFIENLQSDMNKEEGDWRVAHSEWQQAETEWHNTQKTWEQTKSSLRHTINKTRKSLIRVVTQNRSLTKQISELVTQNEQLTKQIATLTALNSEESQLLENERALLNKQAQPLTKLLSKAKQDYNTAKGNYDKAKTGYQTTISKQQQMISHLEQQLTQKDSEILTLQTALIELTEQVEGWSMMLGNLQDNATWLNSQLKPLETRL